MLYNRGKGRLDINTIHENLPLLFGDQNSSGINVLLENMKQIGKQIENSTNFDFPFLKGEFGWDYKQYLTTRSLQDEPVKIEEVFSDFVKLFECVPNWKHPGTMINIIPPVNLIALAASTIASMFNSNFAQDTYAGKLILAELEVIKYMCKMVGWDWEKSSGIFTFGGKATNLYATKIALNKVNPSCLWEGTGKKKYYVLSSETCHPCHQQVCNWVGIGENACINVACHADGTISLSNFEKIARRILEQGDILCAVNLNGGNTNDLVIDPIKEVHDIVQRLKSEFSLEYSPHIHVDSVIGWAYLFFDGEDLSYMDISDQTRDRLELIVNKAKQFCYADSLGIDFHKMGFCAYTSSLFMLKDKEDFGLLNSKKRSPSNVVGYGDYNPYEYSLELSRSGSGAIAALFSLKTLGRRGFREIICSWMESVAVFRDKLSKCANVFLINPQSFGFATLFILVPYSVDLEKLKQMDESEVKEIRELNQKFNSYLLDENLKGNRNIYFTVSRSYIIDGMKESVGAQKAYPASVYFTPQLSKKYGEEVVSMIDEFFKCMPHTSTRVIKDDMVYDN